MPKINFIEYSSYNELCKILINFNRRKQIKLPNKYKILKPKKIMEDFKKNFLKNKKKIEFDIFDYFANFLSFLYMNFNYLRHKLYNHYYNYFSSKIISFKD